MNEESGALAVMFLDTGTDIRSHVFIAPGTERVEGEAAEKRYYASPSYLPKLPFRPATTEEGEDLIARDSLFDPTRHVGIARIDQDVVEPMCSLLERHRWSGQSIIGASSYKATLSALELSMARRFSRCESFASHGLVSHAPGNVTVTINRDKGLYNGLHLDSWDGVDVSDRRTSRTRVCLNLGPETRHFLFLPLNIAGVNETLGGIAKWADGSDMGRDFMGANPRVPVIALAIHPGEAYVAATDMIIHDASTIEATRRIYTLQIRVPLGTLNNANTGITRHANLDTLAA